MNLTRKWRRVLGAFRIPLAAVTMVAAILATLTTASAGTTGVLHGTITDSATGAPLANVSVEAKAPTGSYRGMSDARGFYSIAGVYADTYTISFTLNGYEPVTIPGVTVFADQSQSLDARLSKELRTIAKVTARSTGSAFQPNKTVDTYTVTSQQVQNLQGSDFNNNEATLITSLPGAAFDSSGYISIHGGREQEEGFQFEGIPYTDAYSNQFTNSLTTPGFAIGSAQLTQGGGNATQQSNGTGAVNIVVKRGTYPSYFQAGIRVGGRNFDHQLNLEYSWATPDQRFSNYAAFNGDNIGYTYANSNAAENLNYFGTAFQSDREFLDNFIFRFGKNNNQSLQLFADIAQHNFYQGYGGLDGLTFQSDNPFFTSFYGPILGVSNTELQKITPLYPYQPSATSSLASVGRYPQVYYQPNAAVKLGYTINLNSSTYLQALLYQVNAVTKFDFVNGGASAVGVGDVNLDQGGRTTGGTIQLTKQLGAKNLLQLGFDYAFLSPNDEFQSLGYGFLGGLLDHIGSSTQPYYLNGLSTFYAFFNPNDANCPLNGGPGANYCGYAYRANPGAAQLSYPFFDQVAVTNRQDFSVYLNDKIDVTSKFTAELGLRLDAANYQMPTPGLDPNDCTSQYVPSSTTPNANYNPNAPLGNGNCPFSATFNVDQAAVRPRVLQPRVGLSYQFNRDTSARFTYGRSSFFAPIGQVDLHVNPGTYAAYNGIGPYNAFAASAPNQSNPANTACGIVGFEVPCKSFGEQLYWIQQNFDGVPFQPVKPEVSNNYQLTLSHQFEKGFLRGVSFSVAPWYRKQYDTTALVAKPIFQANGLPLIENGSVQTYPAVATNLGNTFADGVDLNVTRESLLGWSGQFTAYYINEFSSVIPTGFNEDFFPSIPYASVLTNQLYRAGFISPFQATLALTYKTANGWRINPRLHYDEGYPIGTGTLTTAYVNGGAVLPNTNAVPGSSASQVGISPTYYVDPMNPGSLFNPNVVASTGAQNSSQPGGILSPANLNADITIEYAPAKRPYTIGLEVDNLFNQRYSGAFANDRFQPIATGIGGPLTGYSAVPASYTAPWATSLYSNSIRGNEYYLNRINQSGTNFYFYIQTKL